MNYFLLFCSITETKILSRIPPKQNHLRASTSYLLVPSENRMPASLPPSVEKLIEALQILPGVGSKSAARFGFFLLKAEEIHTRRLAESLQELKEKVRYCDVCAHITEAPICDICQNSQRDNQTICVVSNPLDVIAIERAGSYQGFYHVLHGEISPMQGIGPEDLFIDLLTKRLDQSQTTGEPIREIILATNPTMEGETTAMYLSRLYRDREINMSRLARGLPVGGDLEYADEVTLGSAIENRRKFVS